MWMDGRVQGSENSLRVEQAGYQGRCRKGKPEKYGHQDGSTVNESHLVRDRAEPQ